MTVVDINAIDDGLVVYDELKTSEMLIRMLMS